MRPRLLRRRSSRHPATALLGALAIGAVLAGCAHTTPGRPLAIGAASALPASASSHVVMLVMENAEYSDVIGSPSAPYVNALARRYGLARASYAIGHPSLPNYLALSGGSTHGISSDCTDCHVAAPSIVEQLEGAGISWKAYLEGVPGPCFQGSGSGGYAKKHNPFAYYDAVAGSPARCGKLVGFDQLASDLRLGSLPSYSWISPNLCDDGHDCGVSGGDRFLARTVPAILRELGPKGFLVLTWDEGSSDTGCCGSAHGGRVVTILAGPRVRPGGREDRPLDHYGVLATVERALGLPLLGGASERRSGSLTGLFAEPPRLR